MNNDLYKKYYIINSSIGEALVDRKTKEIIQDKTLLFDVRTSISNQRRVEFEEIKSAYSNYIVAFNCDGEEIAVNKETGFIDKNKELIDKIKFGSAWVDAKGLTLDIDPLNLTPIDEAHRLQLAFRHDERVTYSDIIREVQEQLVETGNIDTEKLYFRAEKCRHSLAVELYEHLLNNPKYLISLNNWVRDLTPEALEPTEDLTTLSGKKVNSMSHKLN